MYFIKGTLLKSTFQTIGTETKVRAILTLAVMTQDYRDLRKYLIRIFRGLHLIVPYSSRPQPTLFRK